MQESGNGRYPDSFYARISALGVGYDRQRILEMGADGDGLSRVFAQRGGRVTVVDPDAARLGNVRRLAQAENVVMRYHEADAGKTGLPAAAWDAIVVGASWQRWEAPRVLAEARRLLMPDGLLAVCYCDPLPDRDVVACTAEELILKYRLDWEGAGGIRRPYVPAWMPSEFELTAMFTYRERLSFTRAAWQAEVLARGGIDGLGSDAVDRFREEHGRLLDVLARSDGVAVLHAVGAYLLAPMTGSENTIYPA